MALRKKTSIIYIISLLMASLIFLAGCSQQPPTDQQQYDQQRPQWQGDGMGRRNPENLTEEERANLRQRMTGGSGNMTQEQRQAYMQERFESVKKLCDGKSEGDACTITTPRGDRAGNCTSQNGVLACITPRPMGNRGPQPDSGIPISPQGE